MNGGEQHQEPREESRRRERRRSGHTPRVAEVRRKPRKQGAFGWLRKAVYSQKSPLLTLVVVLLGIALTAFILTMMTKTTPSLPPGVTNPTRSH